MSKIPVSSSTTTWQTLDEYFVSWVKIGKIRGVESPKRTIKRRSHNNAEHPETNKKPADRLFTDTVGRNNYIRTMAALHKCTPSPIANP